MKRVFEVAEELRLDPSQLIQLLRQMDVPVRSHMSSVDSANVARLHARLERERRGETVTTTAAPVRRRRRRRRAAPPPLTTATPDVEVEKGIRASPEAAEEETVAVEVPEVESPVEAEIEAGTDAEPEPGTEAETEPPPAEAESEPEAEVAPKPAEAPEVPAPEAAVPAEPDASVEVAEPDVAEPEAQPAEPEAEPAEPAARVEAPPAPARPVRRPKPVRRDMPSPASPPAPSAPRASAGPGGKVRISAEGYTVDGRKKSRGGDGKKRRRVDRNAVQQNFRKTLAAMGQSSPRKRRRETQQQQREAEREQRELERRTEKATVRVNEFLTVSELADLIEVPPQAIITSAFKNLGLMVTINQRLDFGQIELICEEAGFTAIREEGFEADLKSDDEDLPEDESQLVPRPPIVTVMGHVDHGKTSLLDRIRSTNVIAGEAGGITQHIGAYHVVLSEGRTITFLDTPGHEAFTAMRARGAEVTDIVILVVAADDSVMPQTIEAISHARNASVPIVVAVNKVDLPTADVNRVKRELIAREVVLEDFGGEILGADVSAKTGEGLEDLLEKVLLQAEILELKANPEREARGTVVEAQLDRGMGPVATVLVERGTLEVGVDFVCGLHGGRVRALLDERGRKVTSAGPGIPVRVLGIEGVPQAGDSLVVLPAARVREIVSRRRQLEREKDIRRRATGTRLEDVFAAVKAGQRARLNVVIKGDTDGSVQALSDSLERLSTDEVSVEVIHRAVGGINESDILLASTSEAIIVGFHVRPDAGAAAAAERESIEIRIYNVIYEAVEEIRLALEGLLAPEQREITVGMAEIRELFRVPKAGTIAGCYVQSGTMRRNLPIRLLRDQIQIYQGRIDSLRRFKEDVRQVKDGYECGISIENYNDIKVGDVIECYEVVEVARTLSGAPAG